MSRSDYETLKKKIRMYAQTWLTKDKTAVLDVFSPKLLFYTSTSKTMPDGAQHSVFGIYDFLNDFPSSEDITISIYNESYSLRDDKAWGYTQVVARVMQDEECYEFDAMLSTTWKNMNDDWKIIELRQQIISVSKESETFFSKQWYMDCEHTQRYPMILGEDDSPWNREAMKKDYLSEEEHVKDCIYKYYYGIEHQVFQYCYDCLSINYGAYTMQGMGEERRNLVLQEKYKRIAKSFDPHPILITNVKIEGDRAYVLGGNVMIQTNQQVTPMKQYMNSQNKYELIKENEIWKIAYLREFSGIFEMEDKG